MENESQKYEKWNEKRNQTNMHSHLCSYFVNIIPMDFNWRLTQVEGNFQKKKLFVHFTLSF